MSYAPELSVLLGLIHTLDAHRVHTDDHFVYLSSLRGDSA
jgi:hypothetical protein